MPTSLTIGYGDQAGYDRIDPAPVQVRNRDGREVERREGTFLRADLPVAGFALIEAADLDEAVQLVSGTPCAVAHGGVEVWPLIP